MNKDERDEVFRRLGENIYYITQQADAQVYERWAKLGLTQEFADWIVHAYKSFHKKGYVDGGFLAGESLINNLANKKEVTVTLWDSIADMNSHDVLGKYKIPIFQGTLNDFLKENDNLDSDEMKAIDQLKVDETCYLSSGQGYMVLRRYR